VPSSKVVPKPDSFCIPTTNPIKFQAGSRISVENEKTSFGPLSLIPGYQFCPFGLISFGNAKILVFKMLACIAASNSH